MKKIIKHSKVYLVVSALSLFVGPLHCNVAKASSETLSSNTATCEETSDVHSGSLQLAMNEKSDSGNEIIDFSEDTMQNVLHPLFDNIDIIIPGGPHCRPAGHLRKHNLRPQATPLDWQIFSVKAFLHLYTTKFEDFFVNIKDETPKSRKGLKHRVVRDVTNDMVSMHAFDLNKSLNQDRTRVRKEALERFKAVDSILNKSTKFMILCGRNKSSTEEIISLAESFSKIYPEKELVMVNVKDSGTKNKNDKIRGKVFKNSSTKVTAVEFYIADSFKGADWLGNNEKWAKIVNSINLKK